MTRYGAGYRYRSGPPDRGDYGGDFRRSFGRDYAESPETFRGRGERPDPRGWSRPEYNVSFGMDDDSRGAIYDRYYGPSGNAGGARREGSVREWRTGEPWGGGESDVDQIRARDLMTENPEIATPETSLADVSRRMRDLDVGIIPVVDSADNGLLQGVITDRDIVIRAAADGVDMDSARVGDYMSRGVSSVGEWDSVRDIFSVMKRERVRRVPVTDFGGKLVGIVATADLAVDYARLDEEREIEVEEVFGRLSEPARPRGIGGGRDSHAAGGAGRHWGNDEYDRDFGERIRDRWQTLKREARHLLDRGYDRGWRLPGR